MEMGIQPDLFIITDSVFQELKHRDPFVSLDRILHHELSAMYPKLHDGFRHDGAIKAMPVTFSGICLAYNPRMFDKHNVPLPRQGWNMEQFMDAAGQLTFDTNRDGIIDTFGFSLPSRFNRWNVIAMQNGVDFNKPNKKALLDTLTFIHDLIYRRRIGLISHLQQHRTAFQNEQVAMMMTTAIELAGFEDKLPFKPRFAPMPFGAASKTMVIANAIMVHSSSTERELAIQFLQTACYPDIQAQIANSRFLSVLHSINEQFWDPLDLESLHLTDGQLHDAYYQFETLPDTQIMQEVNNEMLLYWEGMESAAQCAKRLNKILSPRKKVPQK
jgi:multiple sugar transport system substrate-binding protein